MRMSRSSYLYQSKKDDSYWENLLEDLVQKHPREGFWKNYHRIRNKGELVNHKRLHRIYKTKGLSIRRRVKKRLPARAKEQIQIPTHFTQTWSIDFTSDVLTNGRRFRSFNVIDDYNREVLFIESDYSIKSSRVLWVLKHLINRYGKPQRIRMDNGPEFIANIAKTWSQVQEIEFKYIQPGKPTQNALIERFNRTFRENVLDAYLFENLEQVWEQTQLWQEEYNHKRSHDALGGLAPVQYRLKQIGACSASATPSLHSPQSVLITNQ